MSAENPISETLADAFGEMVHRYAAGDWTPSDPNPPRVSIGHESYDFESLCNVVEKFGDPLPDELVNLLLAHIYVQNVDLRQDLARKASYSSAARSLRLAIERRKDAYRRLEEIRRSRE